MVGFWNHINSKFCSHETLEGTLKNLVSSVEFAFRRQLGFGIVACVFQSLQVTHPLSEQFFGLERTGQWKQALADRGRIGVEVPLTYLGFFQINHTFVR